MLSAYTYILSDMVSKVKNFVLFFDATLLPKENILVMERKDKHKNLLLFVTCSWSDANKPSNHALHCPNHRWLLEEDDI